MDRWYVAQTHSRAEETALAHLKRQGFRAYLPRYRKKRRHARKTELVERPLFPGYLFVCLDVARMRWRPIRSTVGVRLLICDGDRPLAVPEGVVEDIRARETEDGVVPIAETPPFAPGDTVQVTEGPFRDQVGWFERLADKDRVIVLLNLLGRPMRVPLTASSVSAYL